MSRGRIIFSTMFISLVLLGLLAACGGGQGPAPESSPADTLPTGATGEDLVQERCTTCHGLDRVQAAAKTQAGWEATVERMRSRGAKLTDAEAQTVVEYLAETHAP